MKADAEALSDTGQQIADKCPVRMSFQGGCPRLSARPGGGDGGAPLVGGRDPRPLVPLYAGRGRANLQEEL